MKPANLPEKFKTIIDKLVAVAVRNGYTLYAVGGFVRDLYLGRESKDLDIMAEGPSGGIGFAAIASRELGIREPVIFPRFGTAKLTIDGEEIEFVMPRTETYREDSRKPDTGSGTLAQDALRRDFTVNALFLRLNDMQILDLTGSGFKDLAARIIRVTDPPNADIIFSQDPLRMMRAARQSIQLGFVIEPLTSEAIRRNSSRLGIISVERVRDELTKILLSDRPAEGIRLLEQSDLLPRILPELPAASLSRLLPALARVPAEPEYRLGALLYELDAAAVRGILVRLKYPNEIIDAVSFLVRHRADPYGYQPGWSDAAVRRFIRDMGYRLVQVLFLARQTGIGEQLVTAAQFEDRIVAVEKDIPVSALPELMSGEELMRLASRPSGEWIGRLKNHIADRQLENPLLDKDEAAALACEWLEKNPAMI